METKDILIKESACSNILLLKEGLFWKAYELSAYCLYGRFGFKPTKKSVRKIGEEVVSVGFPEQSLKKFFPDACPDGNECVISEEKRNDGFLDWKASLPIAGVDLHQADSSTSTDDISDVEVQILSFPIESKTPLECMLFLAELKCQLLKKG